MNMENLVKKACGYDKVEKEYTYDDEGRLIKKVVATRHTSGDVDAMRAVLLLCEGGE